MKDDLRSNPIDRGLAECVAAFVLERYNTIIGASSAATLASARRGRTPPEAIGDALIVTGADPSSGAARTVVVDHAALSAYVDQKVQEANVADDARAVLVAARERAAAARHAYIGQEHLLAAIASQPGPGVDLLRRCRVEADAVLEGLGPYLQEHAKAADAVVPCWTPRGIRALNLAQAEAVRAGANDVDTAHLVVGLVADGEGLGAAALAAAGLGLEAARGAL